MPSSSSQAPRADIKSVLEQRPVKFHLKAGGAKWECIVHSDRASYERNKVSRTNSEVSLASSTSSSSSSSSH